MRDYSEWSVRLCAITRRVREGEWEWRRRLCTSTARQREGEWE